MSGSTISGSVPEALDGDQVAPSDDPQPFGEAPVMPEAVTVRRATTRDARSVGDVFDAAVRHGWPFLGAAAQRPMFSPGPWDPLVADHAPPRALLVAVHERRGVVGFTAVQPDNGELYLLFVDPDFAGRGVGR